MAVLNGTKLSDALIGTLDADNIFGLDGNDTLLGLDGDDTLNGGKGTDLMDGGEGSDSYFVDNVGDVVRDSGTFDFDRVIASMSYSIATLPEIENLHLIGKAAINGTGNALGNQIFGNESANKLFGAGDTDILFGFGGNDTLDGGIDNDTMHGGTAATRTLSMQILMRSSRPVERRAAQTQ